MSKTLIGTVLIGSVLMLSGLSASAQNRTQVGVLTCKMGPSVGLIVGSRQRMDCVYQPSSGGRSDRYTATMTRVGLDLGITAGGVMAWGVFAPSKGIARGALAGGYGGASGDIGLGVGVGANVLVGGSQRSIALQPLSVEGSIGVNLALGAAGFRLQYVR